MKKIILTLAIGLSFLLSNAQTQENPLSNAEIFSEKTGTLIQKEFIDIGIINKCKMQVVHFTDLTSSIEKSAIKFDYEISGSASKDTKATFIDADEVDGLMNAVKSFQDKIMKKKPANYTELFYRSRGGFESGCIINNGDWTIYLILQKLDGERYVWITIADLASLYSMIEQAKEKL